ncbi:MAG TPA: cyclase family protein [Microbacteriaceae bacterium]|nr:cyclase family protein [Microbacteriaceae bacterium]
MPARARIVSDTVPAWVTEAANDRPYDARNGLGTLNLIDAAAAARAAAAIRLGQPVSLARPIRPDDATIGEDHAAITHELEYVPAPNGLGWGLSEVGLVPHGLQNTHLDALNHVAIDGTYYGGRPVDSPDQGSIEVLGASGIVARAVYVDIPTHRGTPWADRPVSGEDLESALDHAGIHLEPGDALCIDMGRDRFEAAVGHLLGGPESDEDAGGGLDEDAARWIAAHPISVVAWDMLDSSAAKAANASTHILGWAIGLPLVDNCDFAALRAQLGPGSRIAGALVLAPIAVPGANGINLNPLVLR